MKMAVRKIHRIEQIGTRYWGKMIAGYVSKHFALCALVALCVSCGSSEGEKTASVRIGSEIKELYGEIILAVPETGRVDIAAIVASIAQENAPALACSIDGERYRINPDPAAWREFATRKTEFAIWYPVRRKDTQGHMTFLGLTFDGKLVRLESAPDWQGR